MTHFNLWEHMHTSCFKFKWYEILTPLLISTKIIETHFPICFQITIIIELIEIIIEKKDNE